MGFGIHVAATVEVVQRWATGVELMLRGAKQEEQEPPAYGHRVREPAANSGGSEGHFYNLINPLVKH